MPYTVKLNKLQKECTKLLCLRLNERWPCMLFHSMCFSKCSDWLVVHLHFNTLCVLCTVKANEQRKREQKPITKKPAEFHNQFVLLTMVYTITKEEKNRIQNVKFHRLLAFRPGPHVAGYFRKRRLFSPNTTTENAGFKTRSPGWRVENFKNGDSSYSCGRVKTEVFKCDDVMPRFKARSSAHAIRKRYVWTQSFLNTEKKTSVFENTLLRVDGQIRFKKATCGRRSFLNTEENISVFENTRLRVDEALILNN